jgi:hypothetical protein
MIYSSLQKVISQKQRKPRAFQRKQIQEDNAMQPSLPDEGKIKQIMKEALIEALQEQKGIFHDLIVEAMEDIALTHAIREGAKSKPASRKEISSILKGHA